MTLKREKKALYDVFSFKYMLYLWDVKVLTDFFLVYEMK